MSWKSISTIVTVIAIIAILAFSVEYSRVQNLKEQILKETNNGPIIYGDDIIAQANRLGGSYWSIKHSKFGYDIYISKDNIYISYDNLKSLNDVKDKLNEVDNTFAILEANGKTK